MEIRGDYQIQTMLEAGMTDKLVSRIPALLARKGWDLNTFKARCMLAGLSDFTATKLANGETNVTTATLAVVARVLEVASISELVDIE